MSTIATGFIMMRWELLSAVMMFLASQLNVVCRKASRNGMAFVFSSLGLFTSCWFVMGLMGMSFNLAGIMQFLGVIQGRFHRCHEPKPDRLPPAITAFPV